MTRKVQGHRLAWQRIRSYAKATEIAPPTIGVYAIGNATRVNDLPVRFNWVYIGISESIRRRLSEHTTAREQNVPLRNWLNTARTPVEIWYATTPTLEAAHELETHLINTLSPEFNVQHNPRQLE